MVELEELWMKPFEDLGPIRDEIGRIIRGSDPELEFEDGEWFLYHTWGPTNPKKNYSPGIYMHRSTDMMSGYSRIKLVLRPDHEHPEKREDGFETFAVCYVEPLGKWLAMFTKSGPAKRNSRIVPAWSDSLAGPWEQDDANAVWPQAEWQRQRFGENGICWSDSFGVVCMTYGGKSLPPEQQWATGFMASPDFTENWNRDLVPFALPPNVFEDGKGINAMSHSTCFEDPRHEYILHCVTTYSGNVSRDQPGLIQWVFMDGVWHRNPNLIVKTQDFDMTHIGGPSLRWDHENDRWMMAVHAENKKRDPILRRHSRVLVESN